MGTLGDLKTRVADELNRSDLSDQIGLAITSAIDFYAAETHWFQEDRSTASTAADQEYYALPDDMVTINSVRITINDTNDYLLERRTNEYFEAVYQPSSIYTGYPQDWTIYDQQLRLGPIPNGIYPITLHYVRFLPALGDDTDSNNYTSSLVEQVIRARAKWDICINLIMDYQLAAVMKAQEQECLIQLKKMSSLYLSDNSISRYL